MSGPMNLVYPQVGDTQDVWGVVLNALLGANGGGIEAHNHSSGQGNPIPSSALAINADVSWASSAITALKTIEFTEVAPASVTSYVDAIYVSSTDHNLYFLNNSNVPVQITEGNTLNISLVGGIGGDYSTVNALLSYNDASKNYWLQQEGSPRAWAGLQTGDIQLFQKAISISNAVTLKSPGSLAASYTVTWPAALPASTSLMQISSAGVMTASNALASNQNLSLTGTGYVQRVTGPQYVCPLIAGTVVGTGSTVQNTGIFGGIDITTSSANLNIPLYGIPAEVTITSIQVRCSALTGTAQFQLKQVGIGSTTGNTSSSGAFIAATTVTLSTGFTGPPGAAFAYYLNVTTGSGSSVTGIQVLCNATIIA